jgi:tripartite-type tricarboxylate transporter receptor subunit TctC
MKLAPFARPLVSIGTVLATATALAPAAHAQDKWPSQRITLVVPFGAGTVTDAVARIIADQFQTALGQPVVVENRAGAGGMLGAGSVAKADPDGYTFLMGGNTTHSAVNSLFKNVPYDPLADFTPLARIGRFGSVFATNPEQPFKTIQAFVTYAKANQGKLSCGHGNSTGHITCETVKQRLGLTSMARVPYKSNPPALQDLLSNNIQLMVPDFLTGIPQIRAGKVIPLATVMHERTPLLPDVPTFHETVIRDFEVAPWTGLFGPAKLPTEITSRMSALAKTMMSDPAVSKKIEGTGTELYFMESGPFARFVKSDVPVWAAHAKTAGIEPQ